MRFCLGELCGIVGGSEATRCGPFAAALCAVRAAGSPNAVQSQVVGGVGGQTEPLVATKLADSGHRGASLNCPHDPAVAGCPREDSSAEKGQRKEASLVEYSYGEASRAARCEEVLPH